MQTMECVYAINTHQHTLQTQFVLRITGCSQHRATIVLCKRNVTFFVSPTVIFKIQCCTLPMFNDDGFYMVCSYGLLLFALTLFSPSFYPPPACHVIIHVDFLLQPLQYANFSSSYMSTGVGSLRFQMINMRDDMIVGFFTGGGLHSTHTYTHTHIHTYTHTYFDTLVHVRCGSF